MLNDSESEKVLTTQSDIIASSQCNFQIELMKCAGQEDSKKLAEISNELVDIFGPHSSLTKNNIKKYFNENTLPFIA